MGKVIHRADSRGEARIDWLHSFHSFSFASYFNRERMNFGTLRVVNDDTIAPGMGFDTHPHDNMEIITIPLTGTLQHWDNMGHGELIRAGEIQVMSAGTGLTHSEFNASRTEPVTLLQIWVLPKTLDVKPRYDQKAFDTSKRRGAFQLVVSPDGQDGSLAINQEAWFSLAELEADQNIDYQIRHKGNGAYLFVIEGEVRHENDTLARRDALGLTEEKSIRIEAVKPSYVLCMDIPMERKA